MTAFRGRGGRVVIYDETQTARLNQVLNSLPHPREAVATQPLEYVPTPTLTRAQRVEGWSDRVFDAIDRWGLWALAGFFTLCLLGLFVLGLTGGIRG